MDDQAIDRIIGVTILGVVIAGRVSRESIPKSHGTG